MAKKKKHVPQRTCIACRTKKAKWELHRLVVSDKDIVWDRFYKLPGRGAYVCKNSHCITRLRSIKNLNRMFKKAKAELSENVIRQMLENKNEEYKL